MSEYQVFKHDEEGQGISFFCSTFASGKAVVLAKLLANKFGNRFSVLKDCNDTTIYTAIPKASYRSIEFWVDHENHLSTVKTEITEAGTFGSLDWEMEFDSKKLFGYFEYPERLDFVVRRGRGR